MSSQVIYSIAEDLDGIRTGYGNYGGTDRLDSDGWLARTKKAYRFFLGLPQKAGVVVDFGSGAGIHLAVADRMGFNFTGVDVEAMRDVWEPCHKALGVSDKIKWVSDAYDRLPFPDNSVDCLYGLSSIWKYREDDEEKDDILHYRYSEIMRVMNPTGTLVIGPKRHYDIWQDMDISAGLHVWYFQKGAYYQIR